MVHLTPVFPRLFKPIMWLSSDANDGSPSTLHTVISYAKTNALPNIWHSAKMKVGRINLLYFFYFTYGIVSLIACMIGILT